jgi:hypothetical protein
MPLAALGPILLGAAGTSAAATTAAWGAIGAGTAVAGNLYGASKQAGAATTAAQIQSDAATSAAAIKAKSDAAALAYTEQHDAQTRADSNAAQLANYQQYVQKEGRLATLGDMMGMPGRTPAPPPSFLTSDATVPPSTTTVPGSTPSGTVAGGTATTAAGSSGSASSNAMPSVDWTADPATIAKQVSAYYAARGTTPAPTSVAYWVSKAPELVARGAQLGDPNYGNTRLSQADEFGGAPASSAPASAAVPAPSTLVSGLPNNAAQQASLANVLIRTPALSGPLTTGY